MGVHETVVSAEEQLTQALVATPEDQTPGVATTATPTKRAGAASRVATCVFTGTASRAFGWKARLGEKTFAPAAVGRTDSAEAASAATIVIFERTASVFQRCADLAIFNRGRALIPRHTGSQPKLSIRSVPQMKCLQIESLEGPDALKLVEVTEPAAGAGDVLIDVHAAGVSFPDLLLTQGLYQMKPELPFVPGVDVAGVVRAAPEGSGLATGDRVAAMTGLGGFAEVAVAPALLTFPIPDSLDFTAAAGLVMNTHTAVFALERRGAVKAGETVLVLGSGGGVGTASIQVAQALGAEVIAVASSDATREAAREAGAKTIVDGSGDWGAEVRELTSGRGVDVVVDPVGGDAFMMALRSLAPEGRLLVIGFAAGTIPEIAANRILLRNVSIVGVNWGGFLGGQPGYATEAGDRIAALLADGSLRPAVGKTYALEEGPMALKDLGSRNATAKSVIVVRN